MYGVARWRSDFSGYHRLVLFQTRQVGRWLVLTGSALVLHYAWEMAQAPWFTNFAGMSWSEHAWRCFVAALGDILIMSIAYIPAAAVSRRFNWLLNAPFSWPAWVWIGVGIAITIGFEIWALKVGRWAYTQDMPTIRGIGLLPLLQWILIPLVIVTLAWKLKPTSRAAATPG